MSFNPREVFNAFDDPIPFKNELVLYPVPLRKYYEFSFFSQCLLLEKNSIQGNPELALKAISMGYLEYLYFINKWDKENDEPSLVEYFDALLCLTMRLPEGTERIYKFDNENPVFIIGNNSYDTNDFDNFRSIVSEQNMLELPNEMVQKNVRDSLREARAYRAKLEGKEMAGLEDQIIALSIFTGWDLDKIYSMTIRKFTRSLMRANHMIYQDKYLGAELGGMVSFKDKSILSGWLSKIKEEDDYSDVSMDLESLENKVNFNEAKGKITGKK